MRRIDKIKYALIFSGVLSGNVLNAQQNVAQQTKNVVERIEIDKEIKHHNKVEELIDRISDLETCELFPSGTSEMYATLNPQSINKFLEMFRNSGFDAEGFRLEIGKFFVENPEFYNEVKGLKLDPEVDNILQEISDLPEEEKTGMIIEYLSMLRNNMEDSIDIRKEVIVILVLLLLLVFTTQSEH